MNALTSVTLMNDEPSLSMASNNGCMWRGLIYFKVHSSSLEITGGCADAGAPKRIVAVVESGNICGPGACVVWNSADTEIVSVGDGDVPVTSGTGAKVGV